MGLSCSLSAHPHLRQTRGAWGHIYAGTRGLQSPTAALLPASLVERGGALSPGQQQCARRGQARRRSSFPEQTHSGPRTGRPRPAFPWDLGWEKLNPFPLLQSLGEARCPGQATFSRSLARVPGNKSYEAFYPRAGNQCRSRKPGLRGAGQMEGDPLCWGEGRPPPLPALNTGAMGPSLQKALGILDAPPEKDKL